MEAHLITLLPPWSVVRAFALFVAIAVGLLIKTSRAGDSVTANPTLTNSDFEQGEIGRTPPGWFVPESLASQGYSAILTNGQAKSGQARPSREGFSLTELLVVIAVIALLAGLLLPTLAYGRFRSRVTICVGNFRQLALASNLYATDSKRGLFPAFMLPTATSMTNYNYDSLGPWMVALPMISSLERYGVMPRMWFCPIRRRWTDANEFLRRKSDRRQISSAADLIAYYGYQRSPMAGLDMFWWVPRPLEGLGTTKFPDPALIKSRAPDPWPEKPEDTCIKLSPKWYLASECCIGMENG